MSSRSCSSLATAGAVVTVLLAASAPGPVATAAASERSTALAAGSTRSCQAPRYPGSGYFTTLRVARASCSTGSGVALSHYRCRIRRGARGTCRSRVRGYRCTERRRSVSTELNSIVTCRWGDRRVVVGYQQNT